MHLLTQSSVCLKISYYSSWVTIFLLDTVSTRYGTVALLCHGSCRSGLIAFPYHYFDHDLSSKLPCEPAWDDDRQGLSLSCEFSPHKSTIDKIIKIPKYFYTVVMKMTDASTVKWSTKKSCPYKASIEFFFWCVSRRWATSKACSELAGNANCCCRSRGLANPA